MIFEELMFQKIIKKFKKQIKMLIINKNKWVALFMSIKIM